MIPRPPIFPHLHLHSIKFSPFTTQSPRKNFTPTPTLNPRVIGSFLFLGTSWFTWHMFLKPKLFETEYNESKKLKTDHKENNPSNTILKGFLTNIFGDKNDNEASKKVSTGVLDPDRYTPFELISKTPITHDTSLYTFNYNNTVSDTPAMPICSYISLKDSSMQVQRPYTPLNVSKEAGLQLLVKRYEDGMVTRWLDRRQIGDLVELRGPIGSLAYRENMVDRIGMIAGGTGIAPCYQLIRHILTNPTDKTRVTLLYGNKSPHDILLKNELDTLSKTSNGRFNVVYLVDNNSDGGKEFMEGYVTKELLRKYLPTPGDERGMVMVCGNDGMMNYICGDKKSERNQGPLRGLLAQEGYDARQVYKF